MDKTFSIWALGMTMHDNEFETRELITFKPKIQSYSQFSLINGHLYKTDTSVRPTPCVGPCHFPFILLLLYPIKDGHLSNTDNGHF